MGNYLGPCIILLFRPPRSDKWQLVSHQTPIAAVVLAGTTGITQ